jgi:hypothetical protein
VKILNDKQKAWAYEKWCEGRTILEIAIALDVCDRTVRRAINGKPRIRPVLRYEDGED